MKPKLLLLFACISVVAATKIFAIDYEGNNLLVVLGAEKNSPVFRQFRSFWVLDKNYESPATGIKIYINDMTGKVDGVMLLGENVQMNGELFNKCASKLPYGLSFNDDTACLMHKLGAGQKLIGRNAMKFYRDNIAIEATYRNLNDKKISSFKFYNEARKLVAEVKPVTQAQTQAPVISEKSKIENERRELERTTFTVSNPVIKPNEEINTVTTPFKKAVMDVFAAWRDSYFYSIKADERTSKNFWNYKYTYNTKLKIPGEKYNMLYCFPFVSSQPDFVVILKESDAYDKSLEKIYRQCEKQLQDNFPASEGWIQSSIPNDCKSCVSDLEFRNDRYGAIVLDYSKNPRGKHILYLRFLLFSN